ncbi:MAG: hypothetical protein QM733_01900 [Ilumatobacteraceae bacterium]
MSGAAQLTNCSASRSRADSLPAKRAVERSSGERRSLVAEPARPASTAAAHVSTASDTTSSVPRNAPTSSAPYGCSPTNPTT